MKTIILLLFTTITAIAQNPPSILLIGATAHLGNDTVIDNAVIGIKDGKINLITTASSSYNKADYAETLDISGKHVYPGFIAPNSTLGLTEIEAVRATNDFREVGTMLPNIRSLIAYNTDSKLIPTVRSNGVLMAQITPRGGLISGTSSVVNLDGWNWEDALYKADEGVHINWPRMQTRKFLDSDNLELGNYEQNKEYIAQVNELKKFFEEAKAYSLQEKPIEKNLRFDAMKGLFNETKTAFFHADYVKEITEAIAFAQQNEIKKIVIVGGRDSWMITDILRKYNISVIVARTHELPQRIEDDIDLPYKLPYLLQKEKVLFCLNNEGDMEAPGARNLPFLAGTAAAYGLTHEQALAAITLNTAKILGIDKTVGSITVGKDATLFISTGDALDMRTNNVEKAFIKGQNVDLKNDQKELYLKYKNKYKLK